MRYQQWIGDHQTPAKLCACVAASLAGKKIAKGGQDPETAEMAYIDFSLINVRYNTPEGFIRALPTYEAAANAAIAIRDKLRKKGYSSAIEGHGGDGDTKLDATIKFAFHVHFKDGQSRAQFLQDVGAVTEEVIKESALLREMERTKPQQKLAIG